MNTGEPCSAPTGSFAAPISQLETLQHCSQGYTQHWSHTRVLEMKAYWAWSQGKTRAAKTGSNLA